MSNVTNTKTSLAVCLSSTQDPVISYANKTQLDAMGTNPYSFPQAVEAASTCMTVLLGQWYRAFPLLTLVKEV